MAIEVALQLGGKNFYPYFLARDFKLASTSKLTHKICYFLFTLHTLRVPSSEDVR